MLFDDRLATVLRQRISSSAVARIQFRQLTDLLGAIGSDVTSARIDAAYARLAELSRMLPAEMRADILREPGQRLRNPRLVSLLTQAEPAVASASVRMARLSEQQWLSLAHALPAHARGTLREKTELTPRLKAMFDHLGIQAKCLPPARVPPARVQAEVLETVAPEVSIADSVAPVPDTESWPEPATIVPPVVPAPVVPAPQLPVIEPVAEQQNTPAPQEGISAIVRRIEAFRNARATAVEQGSPNGNAIPRQAIRQAFDFTTDSEGRITWADSPYTPMTVGLRLGALDAAAPLRASAPLLAAIKRRLPLTRGLITIEGAPAIAGPWQVDATPCFDPTGGRFIGYRGRMRRPSVVDVGEAEPAGRPASEADSVRQMLHELRTPVNAIQGFAEVIQQQLFGPTPHEYRALAAAIAGDAARILAGFDDLDRLARLESGALAIETGGCDLFDVIGQSLRLLESFTAARNSGFHVTHGQTQALVDMSRQEAEAMVWRLLATMAGTVSPGEILPITSTIAPESISIRFGLPRTLAMREGDDLFEALASPTMQAVSAGVFGAGFALRLAMTAARSAGGSLLRDDSSLILTLPTLTERKPHLSHTLASREHKGEE